MTDVKHMMENFIATQLPSIVAAVEFTSSCISKTSALLDRTRKKMPLKFSKHGIRTMSNKPENLICEIKFGSHLYGTNTEASDEDYKGIFLPPVEDIFLGRIPKTFAASPKDDTRKNTAGELDCEYYSLHHFLKLACQGQTVAIDMLFAPEKLVWKSEEHGWIWDAIQENRSLLLSKQMNAFVGYARGQAAKYSLKGARLNKLQEFHDVLADIDTLDATPISYLWAKLPRDDERENQQGIRELQIAGKWYGETTSIANVLLSVRKSINRYGNRARSAANAEGVDWKALSHAVRVSKELIELLTFGSIAFPLSDAELLLKIKLGQVPMEEVQSILDRDLAFVEAQAEQSHLPEKVDHKFWDGFLVRIVSEHLSKNGVLS